MPWKFRSAEPLERENNALKTAICNLRATIEGRENQIRRLEVLVEERCATIDALRHANEKLGLENQCLVAMLITPTPVNSAIAFKRRLTAGRTEA